MNSVCRLSLLRPRETERESSAKGAERTSPRAPSKAAGASQASSNLLAHPKPFEREIALETDFMGSPCSATCFCGRPTEVRRPLVWSLALLLVS